MNDLSIYESIFELIKENIYGGTFPASGEAVTTLLATCASVFLFAIPFIVLMKIIKLILR